MWVAFAFGSALFAGVTSILAKIGIKNTDSTAATAVRTIIILFFSWLMVFVTGQAGGISDISGKNAHVSYPFGTCNRRQLDVLFQGAPDRRCEQGDAC